jgi:hypothetical protein
MNKREDDGRVLTIAGDDLGEESAVLGSPVDEVEGHVVL